MAGAGSVTFPRRRCGDAGGVKEPVSTGRERLRSGGSDCADIGEVVGWCEAVVVGMSAGRVDAREVLELEPLSTVEGIYSPSRAEGSLVNAGIDDIGAACWVVMAFFGRPRFFCTCGWVDSLPSVGWC